MKYQHAEKLHNGDEVQDKTTGEIIKVLNVRIIPRSEGIPPCVCIEGVGEQNGYGDWYHINVK